MMKKPIIISYLWSLLERGPFTLPKGHWGVNINQYKKIK